MSGYRFRVDEPTPAALVAAGIPDGAALLRLAADPTLRFRPALRWLAFRARIIAASVPEAVTASTGTALLVERRSTAVEPVRQVNTASSPSEVLGALERSRREAARHERELREAVEGVLLRAGREAAANFERQVTDYLTADASEGPGWGAPSIDEILAAATLSKWLRAKLDPLRIAAVESVMTGPLAVVGISFDVASPMVGALIERTGEHIVGIPDTVRGEVAALVAFAHREGMSVSAAAELIRMTVRDGSAARARMIAVTELNRLANGATLTTMMIVANATGTKYVKRWLVAPGAKCPRHELDANLADQVRPLGEPFDVGGFPADHPGDPHLPAEEAVLCRCTVVFDEAV